MHKEVAQDLGFHIFRKKSWLLIFAFFFIYWAYLIFHTKMVIVFDSIDYENIGRLIYEKGWLEYFRTGPQREPLYPALIALSMTWANILSVDYHLILKIFQVVLLFSTQILMIILLRKLNIRDWIIKTAIFYFGISPAMINAAFSVYYEIMVFPFVAAAVLLASSLWRDIHQIKKYRVILCKTVLFGICFSLLALGRGVFQIVFYFFIIPFCVSTFLFLFKYKVRALWRAVIFIFGAFLIFYSAVSYMKTMNLRYNGERVLCNRHLGIFVASAYKRSQPVTPRIIASNIALIPGFGVCRLFFSQQECEYADWYGMQQFNGEVSQKLAMIPKDRQEPEAVRLVLEKVINHPFQYLFFSIVEALKMPFWESTQIGFVKYPEFLTKIYDNPIMRFGLRLSMGLMTIAAFMFVTFYLWRGNKQNTIILFFVWLMITAYTFCYSLCCVVTRYALPIASMYIVCILFMIDAIINHRDFDNIIN